MTRKYEILLLLKPDLTLKAKTTLLKKLETKLKPTKIVKKEEWGIKNLAYKIKTQTEADYILWYLETDAQNIASFKKMVLITPSVLRQLIIKHEKEWPFNLKTTKNMEFGYKKRTDWKRYKPNTYYGNKSESPNRTNFNTTTVKSRGDIRKKDD